MRQERLFHILGLVDEDLIEEADAASSPAPGQRQPLRRVLAAAACLTLVCGVSFGWLVTGGFQGFGAAQAPAESSSGAHDIEPLSAEGTTFMSYAGPVFPLTTQTKADDITAERTITWDFTTGAYEDGTPRQWGAEVTDSYVLMNHTAGDILAVVSYPYAGDLAGISEQLPTLTVDGAAATAALSAGPYAGGFSDANMPEGSSWNLADPDSWVDYNALLDDGSYQEKAFSAGPSLELPVIVYEFSDFEAPHETYNAATQAIEFTINASATTVLTYGINGRSWDEATGWQQYSYFVPNGVRRDTEPKLLVVIGEDIGPYSLQGYEDGSCDPKEVISGVSCTVTRQETTLSAVLDRLCQSYIDESSFLLAQDQQASLREMELPLFRNMATELISQYGPLAGENMADRYSDGRLDELIAEALTLERVLYLTFDITIPAGSSVTVAADFWKAPSFDYGCSDSKNRDLQGYDMMTQLGSALKFSRQTAAIVNTENIEIVRQNMGFDLDNGINTVELSPGQEHYYLEVRLIQAD